MASEKHLKILQGGVDSWNKWRQSHPEIRPDLSGASLRKLSGPEINLRNADLREANMYKAALEGADFRGAKLIRATFRHADLTASDFTKAHLHGVNFTLATLKEASLNGAILSHAIFHKTVTDQCNFADALMRNTILADCNLSNAIGLQSCRHTGPSELDHVTMIKSPTLPESFLRGCGVPDAFRDYLGSIQRRPIQLFSCFISYSHADQLFAEQLHKRLQRVGVRCWLDEHELLPGDDIHAEIDEAIRVFDKVLLCCSKSALGSWWVDDEVNKALEKERQWSAREGKLSRVIIPLDLDGWLFHDEYQSGYRTTLTRRLAADFIGWETDSEKFDLQCDKLRKALATDQVQ